MVSFHAGFLPHDMESAGFRKLAGRLEAVAGIFADQGIDLLFETGQETADDLWAFLDHLEDRGVTNVGINFDPATMILYDKGDPIEALRRLLPPGPLDPHQGRHPHPDARGMGRRGRRRRRPGRLAPPSSASWPRAGYAGDLLVEREGGDDRMGRREEGDRGDHASHGGDRMTNEENYCFDVGGYLVVRGGPAAG